MAENEQQVELSGAFQPGDIIFECPHCGKSLAIEARGAGYMIDCPDCAERIQVPFPEEDEAALDEELGAGLEQQADEYMEALEASQEKVRQQAHALEAVTKRRDYLEKMRVEQMNCLTVIRKEMKLMQDVVDRIASALENVD